MRRDNPHISKRRGGRAKTGHRKFSLQAFHAKHLGGHHAHSTSSNSNNQQQQQQYSNNKVDSNGAQMEIHGVAGNDKSFAVDHRKLPVVVENELRHIKEGVGLENTKGIQNTKEEQQMLLAANASLTSDKSCSSTKLNGCLVGTPPSTNNNEHRRVRVDDRLTTESNLTGTSITNTNNSVNAKNSTSNNSQQYRHHHHHHQQHHNRHQSGSGSHHHRCHHHHHHSQHQHNNKNSHTNGKTSCKNNSGAIPTPAEPTSTSSACVYFDDDTLVLNDSQSSGNVSPQRRSSFVCSQSSIHREDSSLN